MCQRADDFVTDSIEIVIDYDSIGIFGWPLKTVCHRWTIESEEEAGGWRQVLHVCLGTFEWKMRRVLSFSR